MWEQEHVEVVAFVNSLARRKVWLPDDFERAKQAISEIERIDSLCDLVGDSKTKREAYAKQIADCSVMIHKLWRVIKRAWKGYAERMTARRAESEQRRLHQSRPPIK